MSSRFASNSNTLVNFEQLSKTKQEEIISEIRNMITNKEANFHNHDSNIFINTDRKNSNWNEILGDNFDNTILFSQLSNISKKTIPSPHAGNSSTFDRIRFKRLPREIELLLAVVNRKSFDEYRTFLGL